MSETEKRVLIVDDERANTSILANMLSSDYKILVAKNGEQTFKRISGDILPDLILLDIMLPDTDGFEICKRLKQNVRTEDIPVIFISARTDTEDILMGFSLGGVDYITKPFKVEEVKARVKTHLRIKDLQETLIEKNKALSKEINERILAETAQIESEERYRKLSEATIEGVLLIDQGTIIALNNVVAKMFGYDAEELLGRKVFDFIDTDYHEIVNRNLIMKSHQSYEIIAIKKDGTLFPIEVCGRETMMNGREVRQTALRDLTEQKNAEQVRMRNLKLKGVLETAKTICHEMNQPLQIISGQLELMNIKMDNNDPNMKRVFCIKNEINRMSEITRKLMNITRYETRDYIKGEKIIDLDKSSI